MRNLENKLGMGLSKIQEGLDKSKNKVEEIREVSKVNKTMEEVYDKKAEALLELGINVYKKVREGTLNDKEIVEKCKNIIGFDYVIYDCKNKIEELTKAEEGILCECGKTVGYEDKFCGGCGSKVEFIAENLDYITCKYCDMKIEDKVNYCPCCGIKTYENL